MKKVMIATGSLGAGGIEKVTARIADYYIGRGYEVSICCLLETEEKAFVTLREGVKVFYFDLSSKAETPKILLSGDWIKFLRKTFEEQKPDCVLAMTLKIGALCSVARGNMPIRLAFRETSDPYSKVRNRLFDRVLCILCRNIDGIIFQTEWERSCYPEFMQKKGRVIPNPVSVDVQWEYDPDEKTIVTMGRLENIQKRHDVLIEAFSLFRQKNPGYKLVIYGNGPDKSEDEAQIRKLGLEDAVTLAGAKKNVNALIARASMFVMTSDFEGLSNALVEAMLMGIPCISSDWPGCAEIVRHGVNGYLYNRQNVQELAAYMDELANHADKRLAFSAEARKLSARYDPCAVLKEYAGIIEGDG